MDTLRWIFLGPFGLRSGWRALLFVIAVIPAAFPFMLLLGLVFFVLLGVDPSEVAPHVALSFNGVLAAPFFLVTWIFARFVDKQPLASLGLGGPPRRGSASTAIGALMGVAAISGGGLLLVGVGAAEIAFASPALSIIAFPVLLFFAASWEELLFRGYPFQWIVRGAGFGVATGLTAVLFGVVHLFNPNANALSFVLIVLSGVLLAFARVASRDLWVPIGLHFGWNAAQGLFFGVAVSGTKGFPSLLETELHGPDYLTGGEFGFEASIGGFFALVIAFVWLVLLARKRGPDWRMEGGAAPVTSVEKSPIVG